MNDQDCNWDLTPEQLREFYEIEKALAAKLRNASKSERLQLYQVLYDELYRRVPYHPMLARKAAPEENARVVAAKMQLLAHLLAPGMTVLEVGAGDCALAFEVARQARKVFAVEVSNVIASREKTPANFELVLSDGASIPVPENSVDLAYSNQLMEHLHPDDAVEQLQNIFRVLRSSGRYLCRTPHHLQGPTDVSRFFDEVATGFHIKEYTYAELDRLFRAAGFQHTAVYVEKSGRYYRVPTGAMVVFERLSNLLFGGRPYRDRQAWLHRKPFTLYLQGICFVGYKR